MSSKSAAKYVLFGISPDIKCLPVVFPKIDLLKKRSVENW